MSGSTPSLAPHQLPFLVKLAFPLRWLKIVVPLAAAAALAAFLLLKPVPVVLHEAKPGTVVTEVMGTGTLAARVKVTLSPKVQGRLAEVLVDQNDTIRTGQLLARIDDGELLQQVEMARATVEAARATVDRIRADSTRAEAVAKLTRLEHQRSTRLLESSAVSQSDFDKALQSLSVAEADVQRAQFAITEAERQFVAAERNLRYQQERLAETRLFSPFDGLVVKRNRDPGEIVVPGSAVLDLVNTSEIWVSAWVDETAMAGLAAGQPARIVFRSEPSRAYSGEVARLGRQTDPETREFLVDVRLETLPANWTIGQRAEVYIATANKSAATTVPAAMIQKREGQTGVFVARDGRARWQPVKVGARGRDQLEILEGVSVGDRVAAARDARATLSDGARISQP